MNLVLREPFALVSVIVILVGRTTVVIVLLFLGDKIEIQFVQFDHALPVMARFQKEGPPQSYVLDPL